MSHTHRFVCPLPNGLHARPASHLAEIAQRFQSMATFVNERTGRSASVRSVLGLVGTDTRSGDPCRLDVAGADAAAAFDALKAFVETGLAGCDEPLPETSAGPADVVIPRSLRTAGLQQFHAGHIACRGLGVGRAMVCGGFAVPAGLEQEQAREAAAEQARVDRAVATVSAEYQKAVRSARGVERAILEAHLAILGDPALVDAVSSAIHAGQTAGQAIATMVTAQRDVLAGAQSAYVRERVLDLEDIAMRLWQELYGERPKKGTGVDS